MEGSRGIGLLLTLYSVYSKCTSHGQRTPPSHGCVPGTVRYLHRGVGRTDRPVDARRCGAAVPPQGHGDPLGEDDPVLHLRWPDRPPPSLRGDARSVRVPPFSSSPLDQGAPGPILPVAESPVGDLQPDRRRARGGPATDGRGAAGGGRGDPGG